MQIKLNDSVAKMLKEAKEKLGTSSYVGTIEYLLIQLLMKDK